MLAFLLLVLFTVGFLVPSSEKRILVVTHGVKGYLLSSRSQIGRNILKLVCVLVRNSVASKYIMLESSVLRNTQYAGCLLRSCWIGLQFFFFNAICSNVALHDVVFFNQRVASSRPHGIRALKARGARHKQGLRYEWRK